MRATVALFVFLISIPSFAIELSVLECFQKDRRPGSSVYSLVQAPDLVRPSQRVFLLRKRNMDPGVVAQLVVPASAVKQTRKTFSLDFKMGRSGYAWLKVKADGSARMDFAVTGAVNLQPGNFAVEDLNTHGVVSDYVCVRPR